MQKILKEKLPELWQKINDNFDLFIPIEKNKSLNFSPWKEGEKVNLNKVRTNTSPKQFLFPQTETYLKFKREGKKLQLNTITAKGDQYVIFGARACDIASFRLLDNIFLKEPIDTYYKAHREKGISISLACNNPDDSCFCSALKGIDATKSSDADINTWDSKEYLFWEAQTEKGETLTTLLSELFINVEDKDKLEVEEIKEDIKEELADLPFGNLDFSNITNIKDELFEQEDTWNELSEKCLACGTCSYVCPTCHCYDVKDYKGGNQGERYRVWDSCMTSDFTKMAHGNPRTKQMQRVRQRFMHKLVYYPNNNDQAYSCVGCGRCIDKCPVHLDIAKVIKKFGGERNEL